MNMKQEPERTCIGCREKKSQKELVRIVRSPEGILFVDKEGRSNGRGAYICKSEECFEKAIKTKAFLKSLKAEPDEEVKKDLIETIRR